MSILSLSYRLKIFIVCIFKYKLKVQYRSGSRGIIRCQERCIDMFQIILDCVMDRRHDPAIVFEDDVMFLTFLCHKHLSHKNNKIKFVLAFKPLIITCYFRLQYTKLDYYFEAVNNS